MTRDDIPLLAALRRRGHEIQAAEIERARRRMGPLAPEQESALAALGGAIVTRVLHAPAAAITQLASEGRIEENGGRVRAVLGLS
jgi:glutamyl-tRNA reductase